MMKKERFIRVSFALIALLTVVGCSHTTLVETVVSDNEEALHQILKNVDINTLVAFDYNDILVDRELSNIIRKLQSRGVKVIVLTSDGIDNKSERVGSLRQLGVDLSRSWEDVNQIVFYELPIRSETKSYPVFDDGIIFAGNRDKEEVLQRFAAKMRRKFKKVMFADNQKKKFKSIKSFHKSNSIAGREVRYKKDEIVNRVGDKINKVSDEVGDAVENGINKIGDGIDKVKGKIGKIIEVCKE